MRRSVLVWLGFAAAAVVALTAMLLSVRGARRANPEGVPRSTYRLPQAPEDRPEPGGLPRGLQLRGPSITQTDPSGQTVWSARSAGEFSLDEAARTVVGTQIVWELVRGEQRVGVEAGRMELAWGSGDVRFDQGVRIEAGQGRRFEVARSRYEAGTDKLIGEGGVKWESAEFTAAADTLVIDRRNHKVRLRGGVKVIKH